MNTNETPFATALLDAIDARNEADRDWSPTPVEYEGMAWPAIRDEIDEAEAEEAEWQAEQEMMLRERWEEWWD